MNHCCSGWVNTLHLRLFIQWNNNFSEYFFVVFFLTFWCMRWADLWSITYLLRFYQKLQRSILWTVVRLWVFFCVSWLVHVDQILSYFRSVTSTICTAAEAMEGGSYKKRLLHLRWNWNITKTWNLNKSPPIVKLKFLHVPQNLNKVGGAIRWQTWNCFRFIFGLVLVLFQNCFICRNVLFQVLVSSQI